MTTLHFSPLRKRADFLRLASVGHKAVSNALVLQCAPQGDALLGMRVGFTVTKKLGNAVVRNRIKRRLREAVRLVLPEHGQENWDYVVIGRQGAEHCEFADILRDLKYALRKAATNPLPRKVS